MYCLQCGKEIDNDSKFCPHCGAMTSAGAPEPGIDPPVYSVPEGSKSVDRSASGGKKRRGVMLIAGGAVAAVVLVIVAVSLLFSSPKGQVEKALLKTAGAYASVKDSIGIPNMSELVRSRSYSQSVSFELGSVSRDLSWYYDLSSLKGFGVRMDMDYNQKSRDMDADIAILEGGEDLVSFQMLVDDGNMYLSSPDITRGDAYGFNTETLGADLHKLGAEGGEIDIRKIGFNIFDLVESASIGDDQLKEMTKAILNANKQLLSAIEVEKGGKESINVNGRNVKATVYHVLLTKNAMRDYVDAMADAMKAVDSRDRAKEMLESMGFDKSTVKEMTSQMGDDDPYGELASQLKQMIKIIGDVELDVYVSGGYISAVEYSDRVDDTKVEIGLYLGGENYVDDLSLEISVDGEKLTVESTGNHAAKGGVFTDETTIRADDGRITSELRYEPKAANGNFEWEFKVDNSASVTMEGQLTTTKNSFDLQLEELTVKAAGSKLLSLEGSYYLGPCKGMRVSVSSPKMLADMDKDDFEDLYDDIMENTRDWLFDVRDRIPLDLLYYLF